MQQIASTVLLQTAYSPAAGQGNIPASGCLQSESAHHPAMPHDDDQLVPGKAAVDTAHQGCTL